jgi:hypothetical protein
VDLDPITLMRVRKVTRTGLYNQTPIYPTGTGWTADGEFMIFASARNGDSASYYPRTFALRKAPAPQRVPILGTECPDYGDLAEGGTSRSTRSTAVAATPAWSKSRHISTQSGFMRLLWVRNVRVAKQLCLS